MQLGSLQEIIDQYIHDGQSVALEGFTHLIPFAAGDGSRNGSIFTCSVAATTRNFSTAWRRQHERRFLFC
jgi:hypothetical protein